MISLSAMWFCLKRMPKILTLLLNFIAIFVSIFLLVGCSNTSNISTFNTSFSFNEDSPFYSVIKASFHDHEKLGGLENVVVKSGYLGVCLTNIPKTYFKNNATEICYHRINIKNSPIYDDISIALTKQTTTITNQNSTKTTSESSQLNILELARISTTEIIHPYILIATIVLICFLFVFLIYICVPFNLPCKFYLHKIVLCWVTTLLLLWTVGATWKHVGVHATKKLIPSSSMGMIKVHKGLKSSAMAWFCFSALLIEACLIWFLYLKEKTAIENIFAESNAKQRNDKTNPEQIYRTDSDKEKNLETEVYQFNSDSSTLQSHPVEYA